MPDCLPAKASPRPRSCGKPQVQVLTSEQELEELSSTSLMTAYLNFGQKISFQTSQDHVMIQFHPQTALLISVLDPASHPLLLSSVFSVTCSIVPLTHTPSVLPLPLPPATPGSLQQKGLLILTPDNSGFGSVGANFFALPVLPPGNSLPLLWKADFSFGVLACWFSCCLIRSPFQSLLLIQERRLKVAPSWSFPIRTTSKCWHPCPLSSLSIPSLKAGLSTTVWCPAASLASAHWMPAAAPVENYCLGNYRHSHGFKYLSLYPVSHLISLRSFTGIYLNLSMSPTEFLLWNSDFSSAELLTQTSLTGRDPGLFRAQTRHAPQNLPFN